MTSQEQEVLWLKISVSYPVTVAVIDRLHNLSEYRSGFDLCESTFLNDSIK